MNVIVIVADTWGFDYLGCYGNTWIATPNIDQLARDSIVFENAYAEGCPTVPTRRALLTGRYTLPFRGWGPLLPEDRTLADILWAKSIRTALITDTSPMHKTVPAVHWKKSRLTTNKLKFIPQPMTWVRILRVIWDSMWKWLLIMSSVQPRRMTRNIPSVN